MKKRKIIVMLGLLLGCTMLTGCSEEEDGKWDPIEITVNGKRYKKSTYKVPASGGEYKLYSKNYGVLWLLSVKEDGKLVWPTEAGQRYKDINLESDWYSVRYDEAENIVVNIQAKSDSTATRSLSLHLQCGDAFDGLTLEQ